MGKKKKEHTSTGKNLHNPADEGLDHNLREDTEDQLKHSYIQKQESATPRGVDNDDTGETCDQVPEPEDPN